MEMVVGLLGAASAVSALAAAASRRDRLVASRLGAQVGSSRGGSAFETLRRLLAGLGSWLPAALADRSRLEERLRQAGSSTSADVVVGTKMASAGMALVVGMIVSGSAASAVPVGVLAFIIPNVLVARAARRRMAAMDVELPQFLDLLAASSHAGLSGPLALRRAVEATRGPLSDELRRVLDAVDLGGRWREELAAGAEQLDLPDLRRAVNALTRTETLGSSLADSMSGLAARVRETRRAATTERARKAPVKMLFPLVFLVLPAFLLLTVVPVLFSTVQSIR